MIDEIKQAREYWILWIPVVFASSILIYFKYFTEPNLKLTISLSFILILLITYNIKYDKLRYQVTFCCFFIAGFLIINIKTIIIEKTSLYNEKLEYFKERNKEQEVHLLIGRIENLTPQEHGYKITLKNVEIEHFDDNMILPKIKIVTRASIEGAKVGDLVEVLASLEPPSKPITPGGYNFAREAFYNQLIAFGYGLSKLKIIDKNKQNILHDFLENIRLRIQEIIIKNTGKYLGNIISALMIGEYSGINKELLEYMRISGLAHILSVSGLHLSLVASIFFFFFRFLLNLFEELALKLNVKKIAAFIAIIGSLFYLLISGMNVAAIRAFLMTSLVLIAVIIERETSPMRSIALACLLVLTIYPENIVHPSFQMSFSAVVCLIASYEIYVRYIKIDQINLLSKIILYPLSLCFSSLIASLATAPFIAYHFNQFSTYSIIANLLAVPLTSFVIMPLVIISFFAILLGFAGLSLPILAYFINILVEIAKFSAKLPNASIQTLVIPDQGLLLIVAGILWLCIWPGKLRLYGMFFIIIGGLLCIKIKKPDIVIDHNNNFYAFKNSDKHYIFSNDKISKFNKKNWQNFLGEKKFYSINQYLNNIENFNCEVDCVYKPINSNKKIIFIYSNQTKHICDYDVAISLTKTITIKCNNTIILDKNFLSNKITQIIFDKEQILIKR